MGSCHMHYIVSRNHVHCHSMLIFLHPDTKASASDVFDKCTAQPSHCLLLQSSARQAIELWITEQRRVRACDCQEISDSAVALFKDIVVTPEQYQFSPSPWNDVLFFASGTPNLIRVRTHTEISTADQPLNLQLQPLWGKRICCQSMCNVAYQLPQKWFKMGWVVIKFLDTPHPFAWPLCRNLESQVQYIVIFVHQDKKLAIITCAP